LSSNFNLLWWPGTYPLATGCVVTCRPAANESTSFLSECHRNFASLWAGISVRRCVFPKMSLVAMSLNSSGGLQKLVKISQLKCNPQDLKGPLILLTIIVN